MMVTLRSILFTGFFLVTSLVGGAVVLLIFWAPKRWQWGIAQAWAHSNLWAGRVFCGMDVTTEGAENIPDEPGVALIKHTTAMETYWQIAAFPRQAWVLKKELLMIPLFGWGVGMIMKPIAIDRKAGGTAVKQVMEQGQNRIAEGMWVTIFPEGTRMPPGETKRYGVSGAAVAAAAGCPVVPVAHNAGDFWPKHSLRKYPGKIRFCIGPPIDPTGLEPKEINAIAQEWIENKMAEISIYYEAPPSDGVVS